MEIMGNKSGARLRWCWLTALCCHRSLIAAAMSLHVGSLRQPAVTQAGRAQD